MAKHPAKGKPSMHMQGKGAHAPATGKRTQESEKGTCIICGEERAGTPVRPEFPIRAARKLRSIFRLPAKHTIACGGHLAAAREKRAKYEKRVRDYRIYAALFFIFIAAGSIIFGRSDIGLFMPALLGAFVVAMLPCFYYFPSFGN